MKNEEHESNKLIASYLSLSLMIYFLLDALP